MTEQDDKLWQYHESPRERAKTDLFIKLKKAGWPPLLCALRINLDLFGGLAFMLIGCTVCTILLANHIRSIKDESEQYKRERDACLSAPR